MLYCITGNCFRENTMKTTEYLMIRPLEAFECRTEYSFNEGVPGYGTFIIMYKGMPIGGFQLLPYSNGDVYFHDFNISGDLRGRGIGTDVFPSILNHLFASGYKNIRLQVSSSNPAALAIYKKFGFKVLESVECDDESE